ncbi:MAG: D-alanyl-D-alanine carboxypeptidase [Verrucomicrobiales bacterium]|nr:D-alanyl-D-alanine carboxypeptidase [Verrucomicrobiales bacterium]
MPHRTPTPLACALLATLAFAFLPSPSPAADAPSHIGAASALVIDVNTGRILYEKNADQKRPVASTQKLLTALLVFESGKINGNITVDRSDTIVAPTRLGLSTGETYTRHQLVEALLVKSGNDIAHCLARDLAGSEKDFCELMTHRGKLLGMRNSVFKTASGLPASGQYSTARDMAKVARAVYFNPVIRQMIKTRKVTFRFNDGRVRTIYNTNKLLGTTTHCDGMKTGFTNKAGHCLISCSTRGGQAVISVVLGCSSRTHLWKDSTALLEYALSLPPAGNSAGS